MRGQACIYTGSMRSERIGFGTLVQAGKNDPDIYRTATLSALEVGYRILDTALRYENEVQVGQAIAHQDHHKNPGPVSGLPRGENLDHPLTD